MLVRLVKRARNEQGFTLIELLVVVAIIGLLTTLAMPKVYEAINKAKKGKAEASMYQISQAVERYYFDTGLKYPGSINGTPDVHLTFANLQTSLASYLRKSVATLTNELGEKVLYLGTVSGDGYILVDGQGETSVTITGCIPANATLDASAGAAAAVVWDPASGDITVGGVAAAESDVNGDFWDLSNCALDTNSKAKMLRYN